MMPYTCLWLSLLLNHKKHYNNSVSWCYMIYKMLQSSCTTLQQMNDYKWYHLHDMSVCSYLTQINSFFRLSTTLMIVNGRQSVSLSFNWFLCVWIMFYNVQGLLMNYHMLCLMIPYAFFNAVGWFALVWTVFNCAHMHLKILSRWRVRILYHLHTVH